MLNSQIEELKKSYTEDVEKMNHQLAENKARQTDHLQAKLAARRQRRARMAVEEKEVSAMAAPVGSGAGGGGEGGGSKSNKSKSKKPKKS